MPTTHHPNHLLVVEDAGGVVNVAAVHHPESRLHYLTQQGLLISRHRVIKAPAAATIYAAVLKRLAASVKCASTDPLIGSAWFVTDLESALAAIAEFDPLTGTRLSGHAVQVGDQVSVRGAGTGTVKGFSSCGRVKVAIERWPAIALEVLAPRTLVEASA